MPGRLALLLALLVTALLAAGLSSPAPARAYKAGGHWALAMHIAQSLPDGNRIKQAMLAQPNCVAWGSNGPDLAGSLPSMAYERVPWFDVYHYHSIGASCEQLLRDALTSNDDRRIAFAAGWVTHVIGDMSVHGLLVNPECGVYIDPKSNHDLHGLLEGWADAVIWSDIAKLPAQDYQPYTKSTADVESTKLYRRFVANQGFGTLTVPTDGSLEKLVDGVNWKTILGSGAERFTFLQGTSSAATPLQYGDYFGPDNMRLSYKIFGEVMAAENPIVYETNPLAAAITYIRDKAKLYLPLSTSRTNLSYTGTRFGTSTPLTKTRMQRLQEAWTQSTTLGRLLLEDATRGDYSWFSRSWVTDAGLNDGHSIGSLRVTIVTGGGSKTLWYPPFIDGGGTNHYPYFGMEFDDGTRREWKLEQNGYDDFEEGDRDTYYLHCYDPIPIWRVTKIWMRLGLDQHGVDLPWWNLKAFNVYVNDRCVYWLTSSDHWIESGTSREATWYGGSGLDPMVSHGWPTTPDPSLTQAPRRMWWEMPYTPLIGGQPVQFGAYVVNADKLAGSFYVYRPNGTMQLDLGATAGSGFAWGRYRTTSSITVPTSQALSIQFGGSDDGGAAGWVPNPLIQRRYVTAEQWTTVGDFNGDRRSDIVRLTKDGAATTGLWLFASDWGRYKVSKAGSQSWRRVDLKVLAGQVDADARDELLVFRRTDAGAQLWVFDYVDGAFVRRKAWEATSGWDWERIKPLCADVDGDGRQEVVCAYDYDGWDNIDTGILVWKTGTATFSVSRVWQTQNGWYDWNSSSFMAGDFDGDGKDEIGSFYDYGSGKCGFWMWKRLSDGTYAHVRTWYVDSGWNFAAMKPAVADFDGDGADEIAAVRSVSGLIPFISTTSQVWLMDDLANSGNVKTTQLWGSTADSSDPWRTLALRVRPLAGDPDGDGKAELFGLRDVNKVELDEESWELMGWHDCVAAGAPFTFWSKPAGPWMTELVPAVTKPFLTDTTKPFTRALNVPVVRRYDTLALRYRVNDPPHTIGRATVKIVIKNAKGVTVKTLKPGVRPVNATKTALWRCPLAVGRYTWRVYATDASGNVQATVGKSTFSVVK